MCILDSNLIIYSALPDFAYLRPILKDSESRVSDFTRLEVLGFHRLDEKSKLFFESVFYSLTVLPLTEPILQTAILLRQQRKMSAGDALIAATALRHSLELYTRNVSDFDWIPNLRVVNPIH
ncbi:MAG TPA: PIN domain nuclease [Runella sp.]|nr:PIN domain nuclease [Runella sp.]